MMRTIRRACLLLAAAAVTGCSATSVPIHGSDGRPYVYVDCSGMFRSLDHCYQLANQVCPTGYRIVNSVAPRANPFANLVIDCKDPTLGDVAAAPTRGASGSPPAAP
jgi:hypothetical protein